MNPDPKGQDGERRALFEAFRASAFHQELMALEFEERAHRRFTVENLLIVSFATVVLGITALGLLGSGIFAVLAPIPLAILLFLVYQVFKKPKLEHSGEPMTRAHCSAVTSVSPR